MRIGFDIEGVPEIDGQIRFGIDVAPKQDNAFEVGTRGVAHVKAGSITQDNLVRYYCDGAAMECGTGSRPPTCMAWVLDMFYMALHLMGDRRLKIKPNMGGVEHNRNLIYSDVVPISKTMLDNAPKEVLVSGCNPRFDAETADVVAGPRPYANYLKNYGIPVGCHIHLGSGFLAKEKAMPLRIKAFVVKALTAYAATNPPGAINRWRAFGIGRYRPKDYGLEWTDPGLCAAKNMLFLSGMLGDIRYLAGCIDSYLELLLKEIPYESAKQAILEGPVAARHVALAAHDAVTKLLPTSDDTVTWSEYAGIGRYYRDFIADNKYPDNGHGMWSSSYVGHNHGIESGLNNAIINGLLTNDYRSASGYKSKNNGDEEEVVDDNDDGIGNENDEN